MGRKFFSKDGPLEIPEKEATREAGTFILSMMSAFIASMFFSEDGIIIIGLGVYVFLRYKQRGSS